MKTLRIKAIFVVCSSAFLLSGCFLQSTEFRSYEARNNAYEGQGGSKKVVDGMEIWDSAPSRKFAVLGVIYDSRPGGPLHMMTVDSDAVKQAKEQRGDAVVRLGSTSTLTGVQTFGQGSATAYGNQAVALGTSTSVPISRVSSNFAVIRYLE